MKEPITIALAVTSIAVLAAITVDEFYRAYKRGKNAGRTI